MARNERQLQYKQLEGEYIQMGKSRPPLVEFAQSAADKLGVSVAAIQNYASKYKWIEQAKAHDEAVRGVTKTEVMQSQGHAYAKIEGGVIALANRLLEMGGDYLDHIQSIGDKLPPSQMKAMAESIEKIWGIYASANQESDIKSALTTLSNNHVLPPDSVPQIIAAVQEADKELGERLQRVFAGQVPD